MLKKAISVLLALVMLSAFVPLAFAAEVPGGVTCKTRYTGSGNVILTFYCGPVKNLANAAFFVDYNKDELEFVGARECRTEIDGDEYLNFSGFWEFGETLSGSTVAAGFVSASGVTKTGNTAMFEVEFKFKNPDSEGALLKAYIGEFGTEDGNSADDITKKDAPVTVFEKKVAPAPDVLWGDANGDGKINLKDVILIRQYLAAYDYSTGTSSVELQPGGDVNGDGNVNLKDVILLRQYLADFDYSSNSSSVVLGPQ